MTKYLLLIIGSLGYFVHLFIFSNIGNLQTFPFKLLSPILLAISAGYFINNRARIAGLFGIIGITIAAEDILSYWWLLSRFTESKNFISITAFFSLATLYLFFLCFIVIKAIISEDSRQFEIFKYHPNDKASKFMGLAPTVILITLTTIWLGH